jgi:branched-chain amino acid transport system permease protein
MEYLLHIAILSGIYAILAMSLNLVVGFTGLLSVAQAAFFGIGAYAVGISMTLFGLNFFISMFVGMFISGVVSILIGLVLSKFKDDYYALASLGFNVILFSILLNWSDLTRGPLGIPGIGKPVLFGFRFSSNLEFLILTILLSAIVYFFSRYLTNSSYGRVLKGIREDEKATAVFGYNTRFFKLSIFVIGAMLASLAGSLFASYISFIDPTTFNISESIFILAIIILGGLANLKGSIFGAIFLILLPEALRFVGFPPEIAAQMRQVIYGLILIMLMLYRPQGLLGEYKL